MSRRPQISTTVDQDVYDQISKLADSEKRTVSEMTALLLELAIKEKTRNRKGGKTENNTADHSPNSR
jgi:hypothetical protein